MLDACYFADFPNDEDLGTFSMNKYCGIANSFCLGDENFSTVYWKLFAIVES